MVSGVFIRTVGERTAFHCIKSVLDDLVNLENVHVITNMCPFYKTLEEMFKVVKKREYEYFLALDADVVLEKGWREVYDKKIAELDDFFVFSMSVEDKFFGVIDRGNHLYNAKYVDYARMKLVGTMYTHKPETHLTRFGDVKDKSPHFDTVIGKHGYGQYYRDIFYRFWRRRKSGPHYEKKFPFLKGEFTDEQKKDTGYLVAHLGWKYGENNVCETNDARKKDIIDKILIDNGIEEKKGHA